MLGPWLTTRDEIEDPNALRLWLSQNGIVRQNTSTADMVLSVAGADCLRFALLHAQAGDLLFTGTPEGVGPIHPGDFLHAACDGLDAMDVRVRAYGDEA